VRDRVERSAGEMGAGWTAPGLLRLATRQRRWRWAMPEGSAGRRRPCAVGGPPPGPGLCRSSGTGGAAGPGGCFRVFLRVRAGSLIELKAQVAAALLAEGAAARAIEAVRPRAGPRAAPSAGAGAWLLPVRFHATAQPGPGR
jgi:hypothetical protein